MAAPNRLRWALDPAVSQHLTALRAPGLVSERRVGRNAYCRAETRHLFPLVDWLIRQDIFWRSRIGQLADL